MTEESLTSKLQKVLDNFSDLQDRIEKQTSYLEALQSEEERYKPYETWKFHNGINFDCYEENETHKFPHLFHTTNPQLNNISCMIAYMIKLLEDKNLQFSQGGEEKGKELEIENIPRLLENLEETSVSTQLKIKPPSKFF